MKTLKKLIVLSMVLAVLAAMVGCSKKTSETGEASEGQKGKYMFIRMKTNPTTGFDFKCEPMEDSEGQVFLE
ncbi:MAG: hypothetical protein MJ151_02860, partial [Lachnospiraceae bacterium]|nr:hypothetical protein [Lachnospiraceae bacterium]